MIENHQQTAAPIRPAYHHPAPAAPRAADHRHPIPSRHDYKPISNADRLGAGLTAGAWLGAGFSAGAWLGAGFAAHG